MTDKLTAKQRMAAEILGSGMRHKEAAAQVGVHQRTIENWLKDENFLRARDRATDALVAAMKARAWGVVAQQLEDEDKKVAHQAASQVLKMAEQQGKGQDGEWTVRFLYAPEPGEAGSKRNEQH